MQTLSPVLPLEMFTLPVLSWTSFWCCVKLENMRRSRRREIMGDRFKTRMIKCVSRAWDTLNCDPTYAWSSRKSGSYIAHDSIQQVFIYTSIISQMLYLQFLPTSLRFRVVAQSVITLMTSVWQACSPSQFTKYSSLTLSLHLCCYCSSLFAHSELHLQMSNDIYTNCTKNNNCKRELRNILQIKSSGLFVVLKWSLFFSYTLEVPVTDQQLFKNQSVAVNP